MAIQPLFMLWMMSGQQETMKLQNTHASGFQMVKYQHYMIAFMPRTKFSKTVHITKNIISAGQELIPSFYSSIQKSHLISSRHWGALVSCAFSAIPSDLVVTLPGCWLPPPHPTGSHQIVQRALQLSLYSNTPYM